MKRLTSFFFLISAFYSSVSAQTAFDSIENRLDTIAFLLPFNSQKVFINDLTQSNFFFPNETQLAVEYYQGALLALDSLKKGGLNASVFVMDTGNDSTSVKAALAKRPLKNADLIFGPFSGYGLREAYAFAGSNHTFIVSPFAGAVPPQPNPFLVLANATMRTHCERIYDSLVQKVTSHHIVLLYRKRSADAELARYFKDYGKMKASQGAITIRFTEVNDSVTPLSKLRDSLFITQKNLVVIASSDEAYVRTALNHIAALSGEYKIEVVGTPSWYNFTSVSPALLDSSHTTITTSFHLLRNSAAAEKFRAAYNEKFGMNPTAASVRGYDQVFYFLSQLISNGEKFPAGCNMASMVGSSMNIMPVTKENATSDVLYWENKAVIMLHRKNGDWVRF